MKKTLNIICLLLFLYSTIGVTYAQEKHPYDHWLENYQKGIDLFNKNNFVEAIPFMEKAQGYISQIDFKSEDPNTQNYPVYNYDYLALSYFRTNQFEKAAQSYLSALNTLRTLENVDKAYAKQLLNDLIFTYSNFNLEKAFQLVNEVLDNMKSSGNIKNTDYAELLFTRFQLHKSQNNTLGIIEDLKEASKIYEEIGATDQQIYPISVFNLAYTYYHEQDYYNALIYFKKTDALLDFYRTQDYINISKLTYDYALCYFKENSFNEAETKFKTIITDSWFLAPENAELNLYANNYLGLCLYHQDKTEEAKQIYNTSINHLTTVLEASSPLLALQKTNLTRLFIYTEDYTSALALSNEVYNTMQNAGYTESQAYINAVNNLGLLYMYQSDFNKSETYLKKTLEITENGFNPNPLHIADIKNNLAYVYQKLGRYSTAKSYHEDALKIKTEYLYPSSPDYAKALINYGTYLFETGEYLKSEAYFKQAEDIFIKNEDTSSLLYAGLKQNLAQLYYSTSQLKQSLKNYEDVISIYKNKGLENTENYANALNGKANCLLTLGDSNKALEIGNQSFEIIKENFGKETLQYGDALLGYAELLYNIGNYDKSYPLFNEAYNIFKSQLDTGTPRFIVMANYYIDDLVANGNYDDALTLLEEIEKNIILNYGFESFDYAQILNNKARVVTLAGNFEYAIQLYQSVSSVYEKTISKTSDTYINMLFNYATALDKADKTDQAIVTYKNYYGGVQNLLKNVFTYRSEADKKKFLEQISINSDWLSGTVFQSNDDYNDLIVIGLNNQLMLKSLLLNASKEVINNLSKSKDSLITEKVDRYGSIKFQLSDPLVLNDKGRTLELRNELNTLETELVRIHDEKFGNTKSQNFKSDWTKIKASLKPNEIALEFVEFETREGNYLNEKRAYGAYLITNDSETPKAVNLFKSDDLKAILKNKNPNTLYQTRGSKATGTTSTKGLYELIWSPLEPYLNGIETIYFSPAGLLNQIPFVALTTEDKPILGSQYNLIQLSSTFSITQQKEKLKTDHTLLIGGIDYEYKANTSKGNKEETVSVLTALKAVSGTRSIGTTWNYLPGTLDEVKTIENLYNTSDRSHSNLIADNATETAFKDLNGNSPNIIHIATHGFFFENPKATESVVINTSNNSIYKSSEDPLLRSGLVLAGANYAWQNGVNPYEEEDGILTALEISNLDLSNTDLVVLSACETGLGDIEGSEGVYGLQRAFKMAGVDLIMMSLWEVPDEETSEFMTMFYTKWLNGEDVRQAFRNTQLEMANKYTDNPEKWAAFVLFE